MSNPRRYKRLQKLFGNATFLVLAASMYFAWGLAAGLAGVALYLFLITLALKEKWEDHQGAINVVFTGMGPDLQFVEVENDDGESVDVGTWETNTGDQFQTLRITEDDLR